MGIVTEILAWLVFAWCFLSGAFAMVVLVSSIQDAIEGRKIRKRGEEEAEAQLHLANMAHRDFVAQNLERLYCMGEKNRELGKDAHKRIGDNRKRVDLLEAYLDERLSALEAKVFKCR